MTLFLFGAISGSLITLYLARKDYRISVNNWINSTYTKFQGWQKRRKEEKERKKGEIILKLKS